MYASCTYGRYPRKMSKAPSHYLKSWAKDKREVLGWEGEERPFTAKQRRNYLLSRLPGLAPGEVWCNNGCLPAISPLSNVNFPYEWRFPFLKGNFYSVLGNPSVSGVSWYNQLKIILMPRGICCGGLFSYSSTPRSYWLQTNLIALLLQWET